jgi:hypothetical protein
MKTVRKYTLRPCEVNNILTRKIHRVLFAGSQDGLVVLFIEEWDNSGTVEIQIDVRETDKTINYLQPDEYICTAIFEKDEYHIYKLV